MSKMTDIAETEFQQELRKLQKRGTLFGSRRWGGSGPDSDWDFIMDHETFLKEFMRNGVNKLSGSSNNEINRLHNNGNFKYKVQNGNYKETINVITYKKQASLEKMKLVSLQMDNLPGYLKMECFEDKECRVAMVEVITSIIFKEKPGDVVIRKVYEYI